MADSGGRQYQKLPPGWDCKYDQTTGNCYYINYITKAMQLEDPRSRYRPLQNERCSNESIAMQSFHGPGGSPYHVYPTNNMPAIRAFQAPNSNFHHMSTSPLMTSSRTQLIQDTSPLPAPKTQYAQAPRTINMSRRSTIQETSFSNQIDTDAVVSKIQNMFPTASENHIRLLLKKYMKTIFPKADETLLLDVLANADNNVQKASEKLTSLGYVRKDFAAPPKLMNRPHQDSAECVKASKDDVKVIPLRPKEYTEEEKEAIKFHLKEKYPQIAERILLMALESVNYAEDRAMQILQIVKEEDEELTQRATNQKLLSTLDFANDELDDVTDNKAVRTVRTSHRDQTDLATDKLCNDFKSLVGRIQTNGPNANFAKGANEGLLLADYVTWNGANPHFCQGQKNLAKGSDSALRSQHNKSKAYGPNNDLCKGPQSSLAKGSIYSQRNNAATSKPIDIKCN